MCDANDNNFWKTMGNVGIQSERKSVLPYDIMLQNGVMSGDKNTVLDRWKKHFSDLLNVHKSSEVMHDIDSNMVSENDLIATHLLDAEISRREVALTLQKANKGRAVGIDQIPVEVLYNDTCIDFMLHLFNKCYVDGVYPTLWKKSIINPIPKGNLGNDKMYNPEFYRGITLAAASYKLFCGILNSRLQVFAELNGLIADEQNGFRSKRSCVDHIMSVVNIVESRIKKKQSTYAAFIDFKQAYDGISRDLLWKKLEKIGFIVGSRFFNALKGIYDTVQCSVRVNGHLSNWFEVSNGLKQGCLLSPILFNLFINDLVTQIKNLCTGISVKGENVCLLMYADDLVLLARNERELQCMLNVLNDWCSKWQVNINSEKSQIVHFRAKCIEKNSVNFYVGENLLKTVDKYKYLGLYLNEYMDFKITADHVAQCASRALGLLIAKSKAFGGMPFNCFRKLYESMVMPIIEYGAAVWGQQQYTSINRVCNRAWKYFLGVHKFTANAAVLGDVAVTPPVVMQHVAIARQWCRMVNMDDQRLNKKIFVWAYQYSNLGCKNWVFKTMKYFRENGLRHLCNINNGLDKNSVVNEVFNVAFDKYQSEWKKEISKENGKRCGGNKLRTYCKMKTEYVTESYVSILNKKHRSAICKFRCGVAPIRLETGRFEGLDEKDRLCTVCGDAIENEVHVIAVCPMYGDLRQPLFTYIAKLYPEFTNLSDLDKTLFILSNPDFKIVKSAAKICSDILERRKIFSLS